MATATATTETRVENNTETSAGIGATPNLNATTFMEIANLLNELETEGLTVADLLDLAKERKTGAVTVIDGNNMPAPEVVYVTSDKPKLEPLSITRAYEEYIQHQVIARNMAVKTIGHWRYMAKLACSFFSGEANEHTRKHKPVETIQELDYDDTLDFSSIWRVG